MALLKRIFHKSKAAPKSKPSKMSSATVDDGDLNDKTAALSLSDAPNNPEAVAHEVATFALS